MRPPLGRLIVVTDRGLAASAGHELVAVVRAAGRGGADAILYREKDLHHRERRRLGRLVGQALSGTATRLLVASSIALARDLDADGVHLAQADPTAAASDREGLVVGRSCHDGDELAGAVAEGVDYVTISPVFASGSKPGHGPALGPEGAAALLDGHLRRPAAYGLGGIRPERVADCRLAGLHGVAVMGDVMSSAQPQHRVEQLAAAVGRQAEVTP